ncbi:MAG: hypothetical protein J6O61_15150 [Butyrivibrio sp.]|uniref:hypothetical protein n=1 Tax=Butyrivibrio sp. TaxID=28121 RepID=UPI001B161730|nr:hypothetical protein [Butyrivibrio sp.]MBO6242140.1 hypothetical protein [Butyrivibrio sp.]
MKLKRMWPAYCIWALFIIFDVVMVAGSSFFLGLFPSDKRIIYTAVLTVLGILLMSVLMIFFGKLYDGAINGIASKKIFCNTVYGLLLGIIVISAFIVRMKVSSSKVLEVTGKLSLYQNAVIGGTEVTFENDLLSIIYTGILRGILYLTGNDINVALYFEIFSYCLFILFAALSVNILLGRLPSIVFASYVSFMPIFIDMFRVPSLGTQSLFYAMFSIELFIIALLLNGTYREKYSSNAWIVWYFFVGAVIGFMGYTDAGTFFTVAPLVLSIIFIIGQSLKKGLFKLGFVLFGCVFGFFGMIAQEQGPANIVQTLVNWATYYFKNLNTFSLFMIYTDYKIIYLITVIVMSGIIIGFWKNRKIDRVSPWLLSMLIIYVTVPFMGATQMNSQIMVTIFYGFVLACVVCLITISPEDDGLLISFDEQSPETVNEEISESDADEKGEKVQESSSKEDIEDIAKELVKKNKENKENKEMIKESKEKIVESGDETEKQRFVPEGMVLPMETEADLKERDQTPRMKMPKFEGTISLDRKAIENALKDDFDIPLTPGDDFDF